VDYTATPDASVALEADNEPSEVNQVASSVSERAQWLAGYLYEPALSP